MRHDEGIEFIRGRPQRFQRRIIEVAPINVGAHLRASQSERSHDPTELDGGQVRRLHRQRRDAHEACWIVGDGVGDLVILQDRERLGERSRGVFEMTCTSMSAASMSFNRRDMSQPPRGNGR
jgi:hypothetical protein